MYESYADTITIAEGAVADAAFAEAAAQCIATPTGPVQVIGANGTGKINALMNAARESNYEPMFINAASFDGLFDAPYHRQKIMESEAEVVLVVDSADVAPPAYQKALRLLGGEPNVRLVFSVTSPPA